MEKLSSFANKQRQEILNFAKYSSFNFLFEKIIILLVSVAKIRNVRKKNQRTRLPENVVYRERPKVALMEQSFFSAGPHS